jgi:isopenicillin N synthase-like dioxygenase
MSYAPLSEEATCKARGLFMPGHADWGTFSILFSQPVSALQVLHKSGVFKWVKYKPYTLIVNVDQCLELLTGGLFKSTIHRVLTPPRDQKHYLRVGIYYFSRPNDDYVLRPFDSPVLQKLGLNKPLDPSVIYNTAFPRIIRTTLVRGGPFFRLFLGIGKSTLLTAHLNCRGPDTPFLLEIHQSRWLRKSYAV